MFILEDWFFGSCSSYQSLELLPEEVEHALAHVQVLGHEQLVGAGELVAIAVVVCQPRALVHLVCCHQVDLVLES